MGNDRIRFQRHQSVGQMFNYSQSLKWYCGKPQAMGEEEPAE
jgi:hypothetical protein